MGSWLIAAFEHYGYAVVPVGIFLESIGIPVPGETVLIAGGFFARQGSLRLWEVILLAAVAAVVGDHTGYWIGRKAGRGLLDRHGRKVGITPARLAAVDEFFLRHGARTVLFARFISGVRVLAALSAGVVGINYRRFTVFEACGAVLWSVVVATAGYWFGASWNVVGHWVGRAGIFVVAIALLVLLIRAARRHGQWWSAATWLPVAATARQLWFVAAQLLAVGILVRIGRAVTRRRVSVFDLATAEFVSRGAGVWLTVVVAVFGRLGTLPALVLVVALVAAWLLRQGDRRGSIALAVALLLSLAFGADLGLVWRVVEGLPGASLRALFQPSFPSMPTMGAVAVYGTAAHLIGRRWRRRSLPFALASIIALGVGIARLAMGQWISDVLAGYAAGAVILLVVVFELERIEAATAERSAPPAPPESPPPASSPG